MTDEDIKERASNKAFAKLTQVNRSIIDIEKDLSLGRYGGATKEEVELCLSREIEERKVWIYITFLIEKDRK